MVAEWSWKQSLTVAPGGCLLAIPTDPLTGPDAHERLETHEAPAALGRVFALGGRLAVSNQKSVP